MTPQELRVAVAKDVLERIVPDRSIEVATLDYLNGSGQGGTVKVCKVCAIGGLVVSCLENRRLAGALGHQQTLEEAFNRGPFVGEFAGLAEQVFGDTFSKEQLGLIEAAFEGNFSGYWGDPSFTIRDGSYYNYIISAADIAEHGDDDRLSEADRNHFQDLNRAVAFGERYASSYEGDEDDNDYYRTLLQAIMENIIANEGTFVP